jgi:probable F420-dependent oxidoreductase
MRYSVSLHQRVGDGGFVERVREWERRGIGGLWVADHLGFVDPFVPLAAAAAVTTSMQLGTLVINHDFWHPALLARAMGTLAQLAPGRCTLGIGAGHAKVEYDALGLHYERPSVRIERMSELVDVTCRLLAGETVTHESKWFTLDACALDDGAPSGAVPLLIGGNGDRVLTFAAERATTVGYMGFTSGTGRRHTNLSHFSWRGLAERMTFVRDRAAGRALSSNVLVQRVAVTDDPEGFFVPWMERGSVALEDLLDGPFALVGSRSFVNEQLARLASLGVDDVTVFEDSVAALLDVLDDADR